MLTKNSFTHVSSRKSLAWLLVSLVSAIVLLFSQGLQMASAMPIEPPVRTPPIEPTPPPFQPTSGGFDWSVPSRFGRDDNHDGLVDYHWNSDTMQYEQSLLYPESWPMIFDGCRTAADDGSGTSSTNIYKWELNGEIIEGGKCRFTYGKDSPNAGNQGFPAQGTYHVDLTVTYGAGITPPAGSTNPESFHQDVEIKDFLIVSLGDSYASGEGNPDILQRYNIEWGVPIWKADPVWEDKRCHRSADAGPAQAALEIERRDPKTSVTFISFACSGATLGTQLYDPTIPFVDPGNPPLTLDPNKSRGVGILGPYIGQEPPVGFKYYSATEGWSHYIPSQMSQLTDALAPPSGKTQRQIDALTISGGGNDMHFGDILTSLLLFFDSYDKRTIQENPGIYSNLTPRTVVERALGIVGGRPNDTVPYYYGELAKQIANITPAPAHVYVTQYPNQTSDDNGHPCRMLDDVFWPNPLLAIEGGDSSESYYAASHGLWNLNNTVGRVVKSLGWVWVDGLAWFDPTSENPNYAPGLFDRHGYCASDNWIRTAEESSLMQGPLNAGWTRFATKGAMHPTYSGNQAIKQRLLDFMLPNLFPPQPTTPPVIGAPTYSIGDLVDQPGDNGWYIGSCQAGACYPKAVMQVVGTADAGVAGAGVMIEGVDACTVNGVVCRTDGGPSSDRKQYTWKFDFVADGIYRLEFNLRDNTGAITTGAAEIKVALHDPVLNAIGPFNVNEGGSVELSASVANEEGSVVSYTWDLNNDGEFEIFDQKPIFSAANLDGPASQSIKVKVTDQAGRSATGDGMINVANVNPSVAIDGAPATSPEGTAINLTSQVTDPGVADTFTYAWSVKKDGSSDDYATGTDANFSFTPADNGSYAISLKVTDDDSGSGTAAQTINVENVAPTAVISGVPDPANEGSEIKLSSQVTDPGTTDTFSYAWSVKKDGNDYASGTDANLSLTPDDDGSYAVSLSVTDKDGGVGTASQTIAVQNVAPAFSDVKVEPGMIDEGSTVTLSGSFSDPGSKDTLGITIDWGDGSAPESITPEASSKSFSATHSYADDNPTGTASDAYSIALTIADDDGGKGTASASATVNNVAPIVTISAPAYGSLYAINAPVNLSAPVTDKGVNEALTCSISWDDGTTGPGTLSGGTCTGSHEFSAAGVYTIQVTASDDDLGTDTEPVLVVVYDPTAGFVTGGGWINSTAGAYTVDPSLSGKASFGFVSKYQKGATTPTGETKFDFWVGGLSFESTSYDWLVVAGAKAQFKGIGSINGNAGYSFLLTLTDGQINGGGGVDKFRIKIWDANGVVYDNKISAPEDIDSADPQAIGGGSIVIHNNSK